MYNILKPAFGRIEVKPKEAPKPEDESTAPLLKVSRDIVIVLRDNQSTLIDSDAVRYGVYEAPKNQQCGRTARL
jgi:hypothetical protein